MTLRSLLYLASVLIMGISNGLYSMDLTHALRRVAMNLGRAAERNDTETVEGLVRLHPQLVNIREFGGGDERAPLHWSIYHGNKSLTTFLLLRGAHINSLSRSAQTPLHVAAMHHNDGELINQLCEQGAWVDAQNNIGWTPLHCAADAGHEKAAQALLAQGAQLNIPGLVGRWTPITVARMNNREHIVKLFENFESLMKQQEDSEIREAQAG